MHNHYLYVMNQSQNRNFLATTAIFHKIQPVECQKITHSFLYQVKGHLFFLYYLPLSISVIRKHCVISDCSGTSYVRTKVKLKHTDTH